MVSYSNDEGVSPSKIQKCKHIATLEERRSMAKSASRPDISEGANGVVDRPDLYSITKSARNDSIPLSANADFGEIIKKDWENYRRVMGIDKTFIS